MSETVMSEYIKGFDHGCDYIVAEIEQWVKREQYDPQRIAPVLLLLAHLKMEGKPE